MTPQGEPRPLPVTVLGGLATGLRDCVADLARIEVPGLAVLAVRVGSEGRTVAWQVYERRGPVGGGTLTPAGPCTSDALPPALLAVLLRLARTARYRRLLLTLPPGMAPDLVALDMAEGHVCGQALADHLHMDTVAACVDLSRLEDDLGSGDRLLDRGLAIGPADRRTVAETAARHLASADTVVTSDAHDPDPAASARAVALVHHLSACHSMAHICHDPLTGALWTPNLSALIGQNRFDPDDVRDRHGPLPLLRQPRAPEFGVRTTYWSSRRPLHAQRLYDALPQICPSAIRGHGHLWLANRPRSIHRWESAGEHLAIQTAGTWLSEQDDTAWRTASAERRTFAALFWHPYYGERRCELTFTGIDLDIPSLHERLNTCLLTDAELALGMEHWQLSDDPFAAALDTDPPSP
ncbi:GTP-binding protein [Kitasatospora sp. NPDC059747]|uniref:GTP-binding protein n=1 Tax=Kitasatospora sp. NPDC059747 TaxID=3346930 RepID=UPI00364BAD3C